MPEPSSRRALILVDLQNDFVDGGALAVPQGREVIDAANRLMPQFDVVVATQDWHPPDHQSFASQHPGLSVGESFTLKGLPQIAWPDHCIQGSFGAELVKELNPGGIHHIIFKGTDAAIDSYSGFFDNGHCRSTGLADYLRAQHVTEVFVMGLALDYCVQFTALDAIQENFPTTLVLDGCRGVDLTPGDCDLAIAAMKQAGVQVVPRLG